MPTVKQKERRLKRAGYQIKNTDYWWVDGSCGFLVYGYTQTKEAAVNGAWRCIMKAQQSDQWPVWRMDHTFRKS